MVDTCLLFPGPGIPTMVSVHTSCPAGDFNQIACNFAGNVANNCGAIFPVQGGQTYYIRVAGLGFLEGIFALQLQGPDCLLNPNDTNENGIPDDCECLADVNGDGWVNMLDYTQVVMNLGPCGGCPEDVDMNGVVNGADVSFVVAHWGPCPNGIDVTPVSASGPEREGAAGTLRDDRGAREGRLERSR